MRNGRQRKRHSRLGVATQLGFREEYRLIQTHVLGLRSDNITIPNACWQDEGIVTNDT